MESEWTGLETGKTRLAYYPDGLMVLLVRPAPVTDSFFSGHFVTPPALEQAAGGFLALIDSSSGYVGIELHNMEHAYVADPPEGSSISMKMGGDDSQFFSRLLVPLTPGNFRDWTEHCINRFKRKFPVSSAVIDNNQCGTKSFTKNIDSAVCYLTVLPQQTQFCIWSGVCAWR